VLLLTFFYFFFDVIFVSYVLDIRRLRNYEKVGLRLILAQGIPPVML